MTGPEAEQPGDGAGLTGADAGRIGQSDTDLGLVAALIPALVWRSDAAGRSVWLNRRVLEYTGLTVEAVQDGGWLGALHPDDAPQAQVLFARALETGEALETRFRIRAQSGGYRWFLVRQVPYRDEGGRIRHWFGTAVDIDDHWRSCDRLRQSEEHFRQFSEASTDILWMRDAETLQWDFLSPAFEGIYGMSRAEALAGDNMKNWEQLIHPEDRAKAIGRIRQVIEGDAVVFEYRIVRPVDGTVRWMRNTDFPLHDAQGRIHRIGGIGHDVTAEKATSERLHLLVAELQHRTRNLMAVVQAVAHRTAATTATKEDMVRALDARFAALARVNGLLSQLSGFDRVSLRDVVDAELAAHGLTGAAERITLGGPEVRLPSFSVQTFALALHELASNAVKHGAMAGSDGRLSVLWMVEQRSGEAWLRLVWKEAGAPVSRPEPGPGGFGLHMVTKALPYQMGAESSFRFTPDGVECVLALPLT